MIELNDLVELQNLVRPVRSDRGSVGLVAAAGRHLAGVLFFGHDQELLVAHGSDVLLQSVHFSPNKEITEDYYNINICKKVNYVYIIISIKIK
jgi:hypothetical protein